MSGVFTIEHPTRERIEGTMHDCPLDRDLRAAEGPPVPSGRYLAKPRQRGPASEAFPSGALAWNFTRVGVMMPADIAAHFKLP
jgi:hypothetical protein